MMKIQLTHRGLVVTGLNLASDSADLPLALSLVASISDLVDNEGHRRPEVAIRIGNIEQPAPPSTIETAKPL